MRYGYVSDWFSEDALPPYEGDGYYKKTSTKLTQTSEGGRDYELQPLYLVTLP